MATCTSLRIMAQMMTMGTFPLKALSHSVLLTVQPSQAYREPRLFADAAAGLVLARIKVCQAVAQVADELSDVPDEVLHVQNEILEVQNETLEVRDELPDVQEEISHEPRRVRNDAEGGLRKLSDFGRI